MIKHECMNSKRLACLVMVIFGRVCMFKYILCELFHFITSTHTFQSLADTSKNVNVEEKDRTTKTEKRKP